MLIAAPVQFLSPKATKFFKHVFLAALSSKYLPLEHIDLCGLYYINELLCHLCNSSMLLRHITWHSLTSPV